MNKLGNIKKEYYNKLLCRACLSADRALSPLGKLLDIYQSICNNSYVDYHTDIHLCWECISVLKKIKLFKIQVNNAQRVLSYYNFDQEDLPPCLSNLTVTNLDLTTTILVTETANEHEIDLATDKPIHIKQEIEPEAENDSYNYSDDTQNDYTYLEDLKSESQTLYKEIKKLSKENNKKKETTLGNAERKQNYKRISNSKENLLRKVILGQNELNKWRERVRNSDYFKNLKIKCKKCVCKYSPAALRIHNKAFHDKSIGQYTCGICQSYFDSKVSLIPHILGHYELLECKACGYQCYTEEQFCRHIRSHKRPVQCLLCRACYNTTRKFYAHYRAVHAVFVCDVCGKKCRSKSAIERHIRNLHNTRCEICKIEFKDGRNLKNHNQLKHVKLLTEEAFCVLCNRQFDNVAVYRRHVQTSVAHAFERNGRVRHRNEKVKCLACDNVYKRKQYMLNHYRHVHIGQSEYFCKDCNKSFLNRTRFLEHMRYNHEGVVREKNKLCSICGRGFNQTRTLTHHMRTHTGEKPHECPHCDARFAQRTAMVTHVKFIHLKERRKGPPGYGGLAQ